MENLNSEILRYRNILDRMVEAFDVKKSECGKCEADKCECGLAGSVDGQYVKGESADGKESVKTEAKPSAVWDKPIDLSFVGQALSRIEAAQAEGREPDPKDWKLFDLAKKITQNKPLTDEEISTIFGVSKMAVSKIEKKGLDSARKYIKKAPGREEDLKDTMRKGTGYATHEPEKKEIPED